MMTLTVASDHPDIAAAQARLIAFLEQHDTDPRTILRSELLFEEVVLNAILHGGAPEVTVTATPGQDGVGLVFVDAGRAFDPATAPLRDAGASVAASRIGGRGLLLLRKMTRSLAYERTRDGRNRLSLVVA
ncbi:ATP-binding protein [Humitalea sp. 24SJ18S-53]|uniref:ATP-binding protein n=1 Tax=Humitalea sp. 24SJ18S-53 TaxID=3422307 RepID=UPI003D66A79F